MTNTPTDPLEELIDQFRSDIMLAAQGIGSDNETYRDSATNVAALSTINFKDKLKALIHTREQQARVNEVKGAIEHGETVNAPMTGFRNYLDIRLATLNKEVTNE